MKKPRSSPKYETAYERANYEILRSKWFIIVGSVPWPFLVYASFSMPWLRLQLGPGAIAAVAAAFLAFELIALTFSLMSVSVLQMMQVEEKRRDDARLVSALETVTSELQRRPDASPVVNWSLFGSLTVCDR